MTDSSDPARPATPSRPSAAERHAWWIQMDMWVARLRNNHDHLWPFHPRKGQRPWPPCWRRHPSLVELLTALRHWHTALVTLPPTEQTAKAMVDWQMVVAHGLTEQVQAIAKHCANGHQGPDVRHAKKTSDLTGKARGHWADSPVSPQPSGQPGGPHSEPTSSEGLS